MYGHRATLYGALRAVPARRGRACLEADPRNVAAARTPRARETGLKLNGECVLSECVLDTDSSVCSWCRLSSVSCVQVSVGYCLLWEILLRLYFESHSQSAGLRLTTVSYGLYRLRVCVQKPADAELCGTVRVAP